jgi:hypothetical protein
LKSFDAGSKAYPIKELSGGFTGYNKIIGGIIRETPTENMHPAAVDDLQQVKAGLHGMSA